MARRIVGAIFGVMIAVPLLLAEPAESTRRGSPSTDWAYALAIQKDGKVVAAGLSRAPGADSFALSRYTQKGRLDPNFGRGGKVLTTLESPGPAQAVAIQPDGKLVAAGSSGFRPGGFALARYTRRGSLDPIFGHGGMVLAELGPGKNASATATAVAIQRDGKIVAVGSSGRAIYGPGYFAVARYTANGRLDPSFGNGGRVLRRSRDYGATDVAIQADGKIVVTGNRRIIRYTAHGNLDASFGTGGVVHTIIGTLALALQKDGNIVVAGGAVGPTDSGDIAVARYTTDGRLDTSFGDRGTALANFGADPEGNTEGSSEWASAVAIQADGKIVAVGSTDVRGVFCGGRHMSSAMRAHEYTPELVENLSICDDFAVARYNEDGSLDATFGKDGKAVTDFVARSGARESSSKAEAVGIQTDGKAPAESGPRVAC